MEKIFLRLPLSGGMIGPGKAELLERIAETGSIRAAALAMGMSYRRAWMLLAELERMFGATVLERRTGGAKGGGAILNPLGRAIARHFRAAEDHAARAVRSDVTALRKLAKRTVV
jgi:molybdate transport system regulatory protein